MSTAHRCPSGASLRPWIGDQWTERLTEMRTTALFSIQEVSHKSPQTPTSPLTSQDLNYYRLSERINNTK
jgi:hypothetical protein